MKTSVWHVRREAGVRCLGLYYLLDGPLEAFAVAVLRTALVVDETSVRCVAAGALVDLALLRCVQHLSYKSRRRNSLLDADHAPMHVPESAH